MWIGSSYWSACKFNNFVSFLKELLLCRMCAARVELYHKITHQKYLMYIECSKKVAEKNMQDPNKGTTVILNELLADNVWLAQVRNCLKIYCSTFFIIKSFYFRSCLRTLDSLGLKWIISNVSIGSTLLLSSQLHSNIYSLRNILSLNHVFSKKNFYLISFFFYLNENCFIKL